MNDAAADVVEIPTGHTLWAAEAMLALRPRWQTPEAVAEVIDTRLRPAGYRLIDILGPDQPQRAIAVAGFRQLTALAWGSYLYVDDLSTLPGERGAGHADRLMTWLAAEAAGRGCEALHLDSGVGPDRAAAHRLHMRHRMRISAHHFQLDL